MADPVVHVTNGIPDSGTGNITTLGQTLLDGANATLGLTTAAAVTTDATGTLQQYLRGLVKLFASITIKAVSTAPVTATDPALVTVLRPDSAGIIATGSQASPSAAYLSAVVAGDIAAAAADSGNPAKIGGVGHTANPTAVTDGQRVNAIFDKLGKQIVVGAIRDLKGMQSTTITSSTAETTIVTAVASTFLDLFGLVITNTSATVCKVTIKDSTAGTTRAVYEIPATETRGFMLPVDSALPQAAVNTAWTATCGTSVAGIEIAAYYVKNI